MWIIVKQDEYLKLEQSQNSEFNDKNELKVVCTWNSVITTVQSILSKSVGTIYQPLIIITSSLKSNGEKWNCIKSNAIVFGNVSINMLRFFIQNNMKT